MRNSDMRLNLNNQNAVDQPSSDDLRKELYFLLAEQESDVQLRNAQVKSNMLKKYGIWVILAFDVFMVFFIKDRVQLRNALLFFAVQAILLGLFFLEEYHYQKKFKKRKLRIEALRQILSIDN